MFLCCRDVELSTTLVLKLHCAFSGETKRLDLSFVINLLKAVKYSHWFDSDCIFFVFILGAISVVNALASSFNVSPILYLLTDWCTT